MSLPSWMLRILGSLLIALLFLLCLNQLKAISRVPNTMSVTAMGKAESVPDLAVVTIGVVTEGLIPTSVKDENNKKINTVIDFIKQQGIDVKDIQTSGFNLAPKYDYSNNQSKIVGYQVNQTITVKVRSIDKSTAQLEKILDGAVANGVNELRGVSFSFADDQSLSRLARKQAIDNAISKAHEIADAAGLKLGRVVNVITTSGGGEVMPMFNQASVMNAKSAAAKIEPGSQEVVENITVVFDVY